MLMSKTIAKFRDGEMYLAGVFDGSIKEIKAGIRPYFFVREDDAWAVKKFEEVVNVERCDLKYRDVDGREYSVSKVECANSKDVGTIRNVLMKRGIETYEADIPFVRRCLIDKVVTVDFDTSLCYVDIETDDSNGFVREFGGGEIVSIAAYDQRGRGDWFYVKEYEDEKQMLDAFGDWLRENGKTVLCGWNVEFDYNHLFERSKRLGARKLVNWMWFVIPIDLKKFYEFEVKGLESYSLEEVSEHEGFRKKTRAKRICEMNKDELREYNMYDVELCYEIDKRYGFGELQIGMAKEINLTIDELSAIRIADALVLRRLRELGYVARNVDANRSDESYIGAFVKTPKGGVHRNVIYLDFEALYPNVIINERIDIDGFSGEVMPTVVKKLIEERKMLKAKYKETGDKKYDVQQKVKKTFANSMYGVFGNRFWRYYNREKAEKITTCGRKQVMRLEQLVNELFGMEVVYIDTDSAFVKADSVGNVVEFAKILEREVNEMLKPYIVKIEDVFSAVLFMKGSGDEGVKKRYIGVTVNGKWLWRGVEKRRRDWCRLAKEVQEEVARRILVEGQKCEDILKYLAEVKKDLFSGKYDDKLIIVKGVRDIEDYKTRQPHVRALEKALKRGFVNDGKISFVWVGNDVEPILSEDDLVKYTGRINYKYYWENQIYPPVERMLRSLDSGKQIKLFGGE